MIGQRLLHYEIVEKLGEGGMGVVYKARDTHLDRFVAIKVLPPEKVADAGRKARFVQEAKAASALNHPNIVHVYDISSDGGVDFIAMEHVAGKTLDQIIPRKGMRLGDALKIAVQIADALTKAHAAGIVHRDLKPSNVMVTGDGLVKVLDFGLAKLTETALSEDEATRTVKPHTEEGTIVGTAAYMSPEQAEGKQVDARSDIFSFGAVLYEMVTGARAFRGDSRMSTLAAVLQSEPAPLAPDVPHDLRKLIARCLRKDPEKRFQHISDVKVALDELKEESDSGKLAAGAQAVPRPASRRALIAAGLTLAVAAAAAVWVFSGPRWRRTAQPVVSPLTAFPGNEASCAFSPDGKQIVFSWDGGLGGTYADENRLYVKLLGSPSLLQLTPGAPTAAWPAWSPDGTRIVFRRVDEGRILYSTVTPIGGAERILVELPRPAWASRPRLDCQASWLPDGKWLLLLDWTLLSLETGEMRRLAPGMTGDSSPRGCPAISPDGRSIAFPLFTGAANAEIHVQDLTTDLQLSGKERRLTNLNRLSRSPAWTEDSRELVFVSGRSWITGGALYRVAASGRGEPAPLPFGTESVSTVAVARQSGRLAFVQRNRNGDINRVALSPAREAVGMPAPLIASTRADMCPQYSPDGSQIAFVSERGGSLGIWRCNADGSDAMELFSVPGYQADWPAWSPDGKRLVLSFVGDVSREILVLAAAGGKPARLLPDSNDDASPTWSRDGKWIYFGSQRGGRRQVWKAPAGRLTPIQVTRQGVGPAQEDPDAVNLYFLKGDSPPHSLWRVPVAGGAESQVLPEVHMYSYQVTRNGVYFLGQPRRNGEFAVQFLDFLSGKVKTLLPVGRNASFGLSVAPDEKHLLFTREEGTGRDIMLVENFR